MPSHTESGSEAPEASDVPIARWVVAAAAQKRGPHPQRTLHSSLISVQYFRNIYKSFGKLFWANFLFSAVLKKSFKRLQKGQKNLPKTGKNWRNKNPVQFLLSVQS